MPFCSQCGNAVGDRDSFCGRCGAKQSGAEPGAAWRGSRSAPFESVSPKTAAALCYVPWIGWVVAIIVLAADRFRNNRVVRFHAFQALYLFVAWLINDWVLRWFVWPFTTFHLHGVIQAVLLAMSILMIVKTAHDKQYSLPLFGELAERSVAED
jgi:uncharacterized membrane protein